MTTKKDTNETIDNLISLIEIDLSTNTNWLKLNLEEKQKLRKRWAKLIFDNKSQLAA